MKVLNLAEMSLFLKKCYIYVCRVSFTLFFDIDTPIAEYQFECNIFILINKIITTHLYEQ